ncbi:hypothetical protein OZX58_00305 [Lactobacillus sp. ESL0680]|uniref:hypothetical protein n=1 Tax=Lactobacillus sp. ESL0680 TaxID=2983210 RepID=UPI0023F84F2F|nr:hypothetical protein [Lactobacillus sp. ESL0680]WEV38748.1 hypothetical protein OZX58_00305 [Lactobacillus sp. ESL0680]
MNDNEICNKYLNKNNLVSVYQNIEDNDFLLGYLIDDLNQYYIFKSIDEYGCLDSYVLYKKDNIAKIIQDNNYTSTFDFFINYQNSQNNFDRLHLERIYKNIPKSNINSILNYCCEQKSIITLTTTTDDYVHTGKLININKKELLLAEQEYYEDFGITDELDKSPILIDDILTLDILNKENFLYEQYLKQK